MTNIHYFNGGYKMINVDDLLSYKALSPWHNHAWILNKEQILREKKTTFETITNAVISIQSTHGNYTEDYVSTEIQLLPYKPDTFSELHINQAIFHINKSIADISLVFVFTILVTMVVKVTGEELLCMLIKLNNTKWKTMCRVPWLRACLLSQ